jgi:hypothetical protein
MSYIFLIYSCQKRITRANILYDLVSTRMQPKCKSLILYGNPDLDTPYKLTDDGRYLIIKCQDHYEKLCEKTMTAFRVIQDLFPETSCVFKCDDDIFPNIAKIEELIELIETATPKIDYLGHKCTYDETSYTEWHYNKCSSDIYNVPKPSQKANYASGPFYYVSAKSIEILATTPINYDSVFYEDNMVGYILETAGITIYDYMTYYDEIVYHKGNIQNKYEMPLLFMLIQGGIENVEPSLSLVANMSTKAKQSARFLILLYDPSVMSYRDISTAFGYFNFMTLDSYHSLGLNASRVNVCELDSCLSYRDHLFVL